MPRMVVGLGNPGPDYENTRHNAGFMAVRLLGENLQASYWRDEGSAQVAQVRFGEEDLVLATPVTFMNTSGKAVQRLVDEYEVPSGGLVVVHDDIDLPEETVRAKAGGGHGGHNGLRSIIEALGDGDFLRVRVGVGRPPGRMEPSDFVLQPLGRKGLERLQSVIPTAAQCTIHILEHGADSAMQEVNQD